MSTAPTPPARSPEESQEELLRRAAEGDAASVRALYREHVGSVHRTVARILGAHDPDVDDVVQQTFLAALRGADRFRGSSKVSTWIVGIASRRALDEARSRSRRSRWETVKEWVGLGRPASRPDEQHGRLRTAEDMLATLSPEQRTVFVLHSVEGYTFKEISEMTGGVRISTLHARLKAARKKLDQLLEDLEGDREGEEARR